MKKGIHPEYNELEVIMTDGSTFKTYSTLKVKVLKLDIDPKKHPAWNKKTNVIMDNYTSIVKFKKRFGSSMFNIGRKAEDVSAQSNADKKAEESKEANESKNDTDDQNNS